MVRHFLEPQVSIDSTLTCMRRQGVIVGVCIALCSLVLGLLLGRSWLARPTAASSVTPGRSGAEAGTDRRVDVAKLSLGVAALARSAQNAGVTPTSGAPPVVPVEARPRELTAAEERDEHIARLEASGSAPPEFMTSLRDVSKEWSEIARDEHIDVAISPWRCFKAGCYSTMSFKENANVQLVGGRLTETHSFYDWSGGKFLSGPIRSGNGLEMTWVFFAPEPRSSPPSLAQSPN